MDNFRDFYQHDYDDSKEIVDSLTNRYLDSIFENRQREPISQQYESLELRDVNDNLNNLKNQLGYLDRIGIQEFPCMTVGETKIPIDIFQYFEDGEKRQSILSDYYDRYFYRDFYPEERLHRFLDFIKKDNDTKLSSLSFDSVRSNVREALSSFLEIRHASFYNQNIRDNISKFFRGTPPTSTSNISTKYLTVTVNTSNHGLDLSASPAYFVTWKKFGSPTSPIDGYLIPATYIFGGSGVGLPSFTPDPMPVDIPPNFTVTLTKI